MKLWFFSAVCLLLMNFAVTEMSAGDRIVLRLMGDSTMADKDLSAQNPERGWDRG